VPVCAEYVNRSENKDTNQVYVLCTRHPELRQTVLNVFEHYQLPAPTLVIPEPSLWKLFSLADLKASFVAAIMHKYNPSTTSIELFENNPTHAKVAVQRLNEKAFFRVAVHTQPREARAFLSDADDAMLETLINDYNQRSDNSSMVLKVIESVQAQRVVLTHEQAMVLASAVGCPTTDDSIDLNLSIYHQTRELNLSNNKVLGSIINLRDSLSNTDSKSDQQQHQQSPSTQQQQQQQHQHDGSTDTHAPSTHSHRASFNTPSPIPRSLPKGQTVCVLLEMTGFYRGAQGCHCVEFRMQLPPDREQQLTPEQARFMSDVRVRGVLVNRIAAPPPKLVKQYQYHADSKYWRRLSRPREPFYLAAFLFRQSQLTTTRCQAKLPPRVRIGYIISQHHPQLPSFRMRDAINSVRQWMSSSHLSETNPEHTERVEQYIKSTSFE